MTTSPDPPTTEERRPRLLLTADDFDAYREERAESDAFTPPRLELKQRMLSWARDVVSRLLELGVAMDVSATDEHPSARNARRVEFQRVIFWRDTHARAALDRLIDQRRAADRGSSPRPAHEVLRDLASDKAATHAFLGLKLGSTSVEVSLELPPAAWADLKNLRARLADAPRALQLTSALEALPEEFSLGLAGEMSTIQARRAETDAIRALLDRSEVEGVPLWLGWTIARDVAITHASLLDEQLEDAIVALGPVYKLFAWAPDNDLLVLDREVDAAKAERARQHEETERAKAEWEARRAEERKPKKRTSIPRTAQEGHRRPRANVLGEGEIEANSDSASTDAAVDPASPAPLRPRVLPKRNARAFKRRALPTDVDPRIRIDKGVRVRVLAGPFMGKVGMVQELDGSGRARVMLGLLAMWLEVRDLIASAEGRERPVLASSHRKPPPAR